MEEILREVYVGNDYQWTFQVWQTARKILVTPTFLTVTSVPPTGDTEQTSLADVDARVVELSPGRFRFTQFIDQPGIWEFQVSAGGSFSGFHVKRIRAKV